MFLKYIETIFRNMTNLVCLLDKRKTRKVQSGAVLLPYSRPIEMRLRGTGNSDPGLWTPREGAPVTREGNRTRRR